MKRYDYRALRGKIVEKFGTNKAYAKELRISENALSNKLNCKSAFDQNDIEKWCDLLDIKKEDMCIYFFT